MLTVFIVVVCQQSLECDGIRIFPRQSSLACYTVPPHTWGEGRRDGPVAIEINSHLGNINTV